MRLQEIMSKRVVTIGPEATASAAWSRMRQERIRHLVVVDGSHLVGVISERDLSGPDGARSRRGRTVRDLMTTPVAHATPGTTLRQAANLMSGRLIGSLPVVEDGRVVGVVTATDVLEELGRGSTRPTVRAKRKSMRLAPVGARHATRRANKPAPREKRASTRAKATKRENKAAAEGPAHVRPVPARERVRVADSASRAPLPARVARPLKRAGGRTTAAQTPAYIRAVGAPLDPADRAYLRRKLGRKLGKFAGAIERVSVRVEDVNGPRGGVDHRCRIKAVLSGLPSVVVAERHHALQAAMDGALDRIEGAVRRAVERRRLKPLQAAARNSVPSRYPT